MMEGRTPCPGDNVSFHITQLEEVDLTLVSRPVSSVIKGDINDLGY